MSGIFLSYSRVDRELASHIVLGLRSLGVDVWWDEDMPGVDWQEELKRQLNELAAVLVIWSPASIASKNVMAEARLGDRKEKLINIIWGVASPPPPFDAINGLPLTGWADGEPHNGWSRVVRTVEDFLVRSGSVPAGQVTSALTVRERTIQDRQDAISLAVEAYQAAQGAEAEASERKVRAAAALAAAEEQLRWMVERHASQTVVRAAQTEIDQALQASSEAEAQDREAAAQLATAARAMTRAQGQLERMFEAGRTFAPPQGAPSQPREPAAATEAGARVEDPPPAPAPGGAAAEALPQPEPAAAPAAALSGEVAVALPMSEEPPPPAAPSPALQPPPALQPQVLQPAAEAPAEASASAYAAAGPAAAPDPAPSAALPNPPAADGATPASASPARPSNQFWNLLPLILGILSFLLILVPIADLALPIAAVIVGIVNLRTGRSRPLAISGIALGGIILLFIAVSLALFTMHTPAT